MRHWDFSKYCLAILSMQRYDFILKRQNNSMKKTFNYSSRTVEGVKYKFKKKQNMKTNMLNYELLSLLSSSFFVGAKRWWRFIRTPNTILIAFIILSNIVSVCLYINMSFGNVYSIFMKKKNANYLHRRLAMKKILNNDKKLISIVLLLRQYKVIELF